MADERDIGLSGPHETIRGGERVLVRRLRPEDMALYPDFLADVSPEDLRLRFFARVAELSATEADKLSHLDYSHEMAFIALDEDTGRMLGLVRLKDELDEATAEFAIVGMSPTTPGKRVCGACMATCWRKTRPCCKCARNSASASRTWVRT
jgi:hypothetical protein